MTKQLTDDLVQPIIVCPTTFNSLEAMITAVAYASLCSTMAQDAATVNTWYHTGQRKTIRRVKSTTKLDTIAIPPDIVYTHHVCVAPLQRYSEFPRAIRRAQVSGWKPYEHTYAPSHDETNTVHVYVNADVQLSPGKLAAQVAHVITKRYIESNITLALDARITLHFVPSHIVDTCTWTIYDNGHTEVAPHTLTVGINA